MTPTEEDDRIFHELSEGHNPRFIEGLEEYDYEEVVQFLVTYHLAKMEQAKNER